MNHNIGNIIALVAFFVAFGFSLVAHSHSEEGNVQIEGSHETPHEESHEHPHE